MTHIVLDESHAGQEIDVPAGADVEILLKENPTTGFRWSWDAPSALEIESERLPGGPALGASGTRRLLIRPRQAGAHELWLRLTRRWNDEVARELRFTLLVGDQANTKTEETQ